MIAHIVTALFVIGCSTTTGTLAITALRKEVRA